MHHLNYFGLWINLLLCVVIVALICIPQFQTLVHLHHEWSETEAQTVILEDAALAQISNQKDFPQLDSEIILEETILPEDHVIEFVEVFEDAAERTGATQHVSLLTGQRVVQQGVVKIPIDISLSGSWDQITQFIGFIESAGFYLNTTSYSITEQSLVTDQYNVSISALSFWKHL